MANIQVTPSFDEYFERIFDAMVNESSCPCGCDKCGPGCPCDEECECKKESVE
jgi:hypothetical protein